MNRASDGMSRVCAPCESASSKGSLVWGLCCLISVGLITSAALAFASMDGVRKDLQAIADQEGGEAKTAYLRFVKFFLSMQMSVISILVSVFVWLVLTVVEIARKKVGISIVLVATFYTMLLLVSHGVGLQTNQRQTADFVLETFSGRPDCPAWLVPKLCAFDAKDVQKYEATYYLSYVGVGVLTMYAAFLMFVRRAQEVEGAGLEAGPGAGGRGVGAGRGLGGLLGRYSFKSGVGGSGGGGAQGGGMSTQLDEFQAGEACGDASPRRENAAYA